METANWDSLKAQGARFPEAKDATPVFTPAGTSDSYGAPSASGPSGGLRGGGGSAAESSPQTMEKLEEDLQVRLCLCLCIVCFAMLRPCRTLVRSHRPCGSLSSSCQVRLAACCVLLAVVVCFYVVMWLTTPCNATRDVLMC